MRRLLPRVSGVFGVAAQRVMILLSLAVVTPMVITAIVYGEAGLESALQAQPTQLLAVAGGGLLLGLPLLGAYWLSRPVCRFSVTRRLSVRTGGALAPNRIVVEATLTAEGWRGNDKVLDMTDSLVTKLHRKRDRDLWDDLRVQVNDFGTAQLQQLRRELPWHRFQVSDSGGRLGSLRGEARRAAPPMEIDG